MCRGQFQFSNHYELSEVVYVDEVDHAARTHLTHLDNYVQAEQWTEAIDTLRLLLETYPDKLIEVGDRRFISVRDFCHRRLSALPAAVLQQYRLSVDTQAEAWLQESQPFGDRDPLLKVLARAFASSWGDDALWRLGELCLEQADYSSARSYWQMMLPPSERITASTADATLLTYPDTNFSPGDINARLVLVSILEGKADRARAELALYKERFPDARGKLGGAEGKYCELLASLWRASENSPPWPDDGQWPTYAGCNERTRTAPVALDIGAKRWDAPLAEVNFNELVTFGPGPMVRRVATSHPLTRTQQWLLSYHPVVVDGIVFVNTAEEIQAYELASGKPAWGQSSPAIFRDTVTTPAIRRGFHAVSYGVPRYCLTAHDHKLYARMGSPLTSTLNETLSAERRGYLVCLDLKAQGRLLWKVYPEDDKLAFEGSPIGDGKNVYIALRRSDVRPQAHVACYDAETGKRRWLRQVCSAETIGRGQYEEATSNLLTMHEGALYLNSNLGAVARLSAAEGHIDWVYVYREKQVGDLNQPHAYLRRDLTPCVYSQGRVFVAPSDSERIYALSAETGDLLWATRYAPDAVHLLGVAGDNLIASGDRLYWINCDSGKLVRYWPDGHSPKGYGRGAMGGGRVYWPTRSAIFIFDQSTGALEQNLELRARDEAASGGNLLIADRTLLIAAANRLMAFGEFSRLGEAASASSARGSGPLKSNAR